MLVLQRNPNRNAVPATRGRVPWPSRVGVDHLSASIMHDLRSPLAAICGCAEMLLDVNLGPAQSRRVASNIQRAAGRMRELLAEFTSVTRGDDKVAERCNLRALLAASIEASGMAQREGIEILLDVPPRIELTVARARIERVFLNLILNAMEAMPDGGGIGISARQAGDGVRIVVEDTGPGIPVEIRSRLFEPFVTCGKKDGLGLGLTLCRETVREHGGDLWVESAGGARFVISLPAGGV